MARSQTPSIPETLWSSLGALLVTTAITLWNVLCNADPDVILFRASVALVVVFVTLLGAQTFARITVQGQIRTPPNSSAQPRD